MRFDAHRLAAVLAVCLCAGLAPGFAYAQDEDDYSDDTTDEQEEQPYEEEETYEEPPPEPDPPPEPAPSRRSSMSAYWWNAHPLILPAFIRAFASMAF